MLAPPQKFKERDGLKNVCVLKLLSPIKTPQIRYEKTNWIPSAEMNEWSENIRERLIGELLSHGNWFTRPPRREIISSLFKPFVGRSMDKSLTFSTSARLFKQDCVYGSGNWLLTELLMTSSGITPVWDVVDFVSDPEDDKISIFGDIETSDEKEITFDEIPSLDTPNEEPTVIRSKDWELKKFAAKERVREARLKAQIAERISQKEEEKYIKRFGELDEDESQFSEYDLTDDEGYGGGASTVSDSEA